jgi:GxxExxY protein
MEERDPLTHAVIGAAIEVHREMGPGLLESVYQSCMEQELNLRGIEFLPQARLPLIYKGVKLEDDFILDIHFPGRLVVELKAVEKVLPVHEAQLLSYLRLTNTHFGLLVNFNVAALKDGIKRLVFSFLFFLLCASVSLWLAPKTSLPR